MRDRRLYSSGIHEARLNHMTVVYDLLSIIRGKNESKGKALIILCDIFREKTKKA